MVGGLGMATNSLDSMASVTGVTGVSLAGSATNYHCCCCHGCAPNHTCHSGSVTVSGVSPSLPSSATVPAAANAPAMLAPAVTGGLKRVGSASSWSKKAVVALAERAQNWDTVDSVREVNLKSPVFIFFYFLLKHSQASFVECIVNVVFFLSLNICPGVRCPRHSPPRATPSRRHAIVRRADQGQPQR